MELSQIVGIITNNTVDFETICSLEQAFSSLIRDSFSNRKVGLFCFLSTRKPLEYAKYFHSVETWGETR